MKERRVRIWDSKVSVMRDFVSLQAAMRTLDLQQPRYNVMFEVGSDRLGTRTYVNDYVFVHSLHAIRRLRADGYVEDLEGNDKLFAMNADLEVVGNEFMSAAS